MPLNEQTVRHLEDLTLEERKNEPGNNQEHWYILAGSYASGLTVLDVGAGTGSGIPIMRSCGATEVTGIDIFPAGDEVINMQVAMIRDDACDIVTCFDVIEHVMEDHAMLKDLLRVARLGVFLSTPNWNTWKCHNAYHVREYTPEEFVALLSGQQCIMWTCGANRIENGIRVIASAQDALDSYCVLIRGEHCTDEMWLSFQKVCGDIALTIGPKLSRIGKWSKEWDSELIKIFTSAGSPIEGLADVTNWLRSNIRLVPKSIIRSTQRDCVMDVLRFGAGAHEEQFKVVEWVRDTILTCKKP